MYKSQDIDKFLEYVRTVDADLYEVVYLVYCSYNPNKAIQRRCEHVFQKGNRIGKSCNALIDVQHSAFCKQHRKNKVNTLDTLNIDINSVLSEEDDLDDRISELHSEGDPVDHEHVEEDVSEASTEYSGNESEQWSVDEDDPIEED